MLEAHREGHVLVLRFNSPETKNGLTLPTLEGLIERVGAAAEDDAVRAMVLTGAPPMFCSGMDVKTFMNHRSAEAQRVMGELVPRMLGAFIDFPKPWIAAVNGPGVGFGATICGLADITLIGASAKLKAPFASLSVVPEAASTLTFPQQMGWQAASWALFGGEWMSAEACVRYGLALEVLPDEALMPEAKRRAEVIASSPLEALVAAKSLMSRTRKAQLHEASRAELERFAAIMDGPAFAEAMSALEEKRRPDYSRF